MPNDIFTGYNFIKVKKNKKFAELKINEKKVFLPWGRNRIHKTQKLLIHNKI